MGKLQLITKELEAINDAVFQELCDCFLSLQNSSYKAYARSGAHPTKQKTTRGTPDCYILLASGNYLFAESTTQEHKYKKLIDKLKSDILSCLDESKTKVPQNRIQEIVLCYNSNLSAQDVEDVNQVAIKLCGITPTHFGLDALASQLFLHHQNLVHEYLDLKFDSRQIISLEKFVERYGNQHRQLATPLDNPFLHRTEELAEIEKRLNETDLLILSGPAGLGKSKLAIEGINQFLRGNMKYHAYAIAPNSADLIDDLNVYFDDKGNTILFVDDVNRIGKFMQVFGFFKNMPAGSIKLVLTVRDYAFEKIKRELGEYTTPPITVRGFEDTEIKAIIEEEPFQILDGEFQSKIMRIANGNARLAIMAALIFQRTKSLESFDDVSELFEKYFDTFLSDEPELKEPRVLKTLGILSFFHVLPYSDNPVLQSIADNFKISKEDIIEALDILDQHDLVQVDYGHAKIGEQNLSTFLFYKVFIKDRLLLFGTLLYHYFESHLHRFQDTIIPAQKNFGKAEIQQTIRPALTQYYTQVSADEHKTRSFLLFFWEFLAEKALTFIQSLIDQLPDSELGQLDTAYGQNDFVYDNEPNLQLLAKHFEKPPNARDALELAFSYVLKKPEHLSELVYHLNENFGISSDDYDSHFARQSDLVQILTEGIEVKDLILAKTFFALCKKLFSITRWKYENLDDKEEDGPWVAALKTIRGKILESLVNSFEEYPTEVFTILLQSSTGYNTTNKDTFKFDFGHLRLFVSSHLDPRNFKHCYYVNEMIRAAKREGVRSQHFMPLIESFKSEVYDDYEVLHWDRRGNKRDHEYKSIDYFDKLKKQDVGKRFLFSSKKEVNAFINRYHQILSWSHLSLHYHHVNIDVLIKVNLKNDVEVGYQLFVGLAKLNDELFGSAMRFSYNTCKRLIKVAGLGDRFLRTVKTNGLDKAWTLYILTCLPAKNIKPYHLQKLYTSIKELDNNDAPHLRRCKMYETLDSKLYVKILRLISKKIEELDINISLEAEVIERVCEQDFALAKKAYSQQESVYNSFDYSGSALLAILRRDGKFLAEYLQMMSTGSRSDNPADHKELTVVWELENAEEVVDNAIEFMAGKTSFYRLEEHFANAFFKRSSTNDDKVDQYLLNALDKFFDKPQIPKILFDILYRSRKHLFDAAFSIYVQKNQDVNTFKSISWGSKQTIFSGHTVVADVRAAEWSRLHTLVEKADLGAKSLGIRGYLTERKEQCLESAARERERMFLSNY
jgi:acylphosphatase